MHAFTNTHQHQWTSHACFDSCMHTYTPQIYNLHSVYLGQKSWTTSRCVREKDELTRWITQIVRETVKWLDRQSYDLDTVLELWRHEEGRVAHGPPQFLTRSCFNKYSFLVRDLIQRDVMLEDVLWRFHALMGKHEVRELRRREVLIEFEPVENVKDLYNNREGSL